MPTYDAASFPSDAIFANGRITGGPVFRTHVVSSSDGTEQRNGETGAHARRIFQLDTDDIPDATRAAVLGFFDAARGRSDSFRFKDPFDHSATLEPIVGGQLIKRYSAGSATYDRPITKPIDGTVTFSGGGTLNYETGIITGGSGGTWSGQFEIQARFGSDRYIERNFSVNKHSVVVSIIEVWDSAIPAVTNSAPPSTITCSLDLPVESDPNPRSRFQDYSTYIWRGSPYAEEREAAYGVGGYLGFEGNILCSSRANLETLISLFLCVRGRRSAFQYEAFNVRFGRDDLNISFNGNESFQASMPLIGIG